MNLNRTFYGQKINTPLGELLLIADNRSLCWVVFQDDVATSKKQLPIYLNEKNSVLTLASKELTSYFTGEQTEFRTPCTLAGTPFQIKVWQELSKIPYGLSLSYQEVATKINKPKAYRAVGQANHCNPLPIIIPCHRVIGKSGHLTGYGGGLKKKSWLLHWEQEVVRRRAL